MTTPRPPTSSSLQYVEAQWRASKSGTLRTACKGCGQRTLRRGSLRGAAGRAESLHESRLEAHDSLRVARKVAEEKGLIVSQQDVTHLVHGFYAVGNSSRLKQEVPEIAFDGRPVSLHRLHKVAVLDAQRRPRDVTAVGVKFPVRFLLWAGDALRHDPWRPAIELVHRPDHMPYERNTDARLYGPATSWK